MMSIVFGSVAMIMLILDAGTALQGASDGINLCIRSVIPSLFPFVLISIHLSGNLGGILLPFSGFLGKLCRIPEGSVGILLTGFLGGYPTGARTIRQAYESGQLSRADARRMLGFCNNAGPAFLFGILGPYFSDKLHLWLLWGIHILSAVLVAVLLPGGSSDGNRNAKFHRITIPEALEKAVKTMAIICGWVVLFRIIDTFLKRWALWRFPSTARVLISGILELTNGCVQLTDIDSEAVRFVLASIFLSFGGLCVGMQTASVTGSLGTGMYFPGKILQSCISLLLCGLLQPLVYPSSNLFWLFPLSIVFLALLLLFLRLRENNSSNFRLQGV